MDGYGWTIRPIAMLLATTYSSPLLAQMDQQPASQEQLSEEPANADIVVTATLRNERLQDVPIAATAVSETQMRNLNLSNATELTRLAPNLRFMQGSSTQTSTFAVRGVSTQANSITVENSVGVSFDGVPLARNAEAFSQLVDIERVEVLRGPQGTLFGKNASAGLISVVSRRPVLGELETSGRLSYGSYNELRAEGVANVPLGDTAALRAAAWSFSHDGFVRNVATNMDMNDLRSTGGRLSFRWQPDQNLDINLNASTTTNETNGPQGTTRLVITDLYGVKAAERALGIIPSESNLAVSSRLKFPTLSRTRTDGLLADITYKIGEFALKSITSYRELRDVANYDAINVSDARFQDLVNNGTTRYNQFTQELRLTSPDTGSFRYVLGAFYSRLSLNKREQQIFTPPLVPITVTRDVISDMIAKSYAVFAHGTYDLTDRLRFSAGIRYTRDEVRGNYSRDFVVPPVAIIPPLNGPGRAFGPFATVTAIDDDKITWTTSLDYNITPDAMVYATYSKGFKGPGLAYTLDTSPTTVAGNNGVLLSETSYNRELGLKTQWFNRRLTLNLAGFYETFNNFQTNARIPSVISVFGLINAKQLESKGIELEFGMVPADGLNISGFVTYTDAKFTDFTNAPCYIGQTAALGCVGGVQSLNGFNLAVSPKWTGAVTARYEHELTGALRAFGQLNYNYVGAQTYNNSRDPYERQDSYNTVSLSAGFGGEDQRWTLSVYANNVFKENFVGRVINTAPLGQNYINFPVFESRRTFGLALQYKL